jgi:hypothetical protein
LHHTFVPQIRYLGFTTRGKNGPLAMTGDLSTCKSTGTLIRLYTVNTGRDIAHVPLAADTEAHWLLEKATQQVNERRRRSNDQILRTRNCIAAYT